MGRPSNDQEVGTFSKRSTMKKGFPCQLVLLVIAILLQDSDGTKEKGAFIWGFSRHDARPRSSFSRAQSTTVERCAASPLHAVGHAVEGIECTMVSLDLPLIGTVSVLEATADSQEELVNLALREQTNLSSTISLDSGDPYGAVLWPASLSVSTYLLQNNLLRDRFVLELGTGTGLVALAAALGGAKSVLATDYEAVPLRLLRYAARNLNKLPMEIDYEILDICNDQIPLPYAHIVVAADIMYEPETGRAMARRAVEALRAGSRVVVGDSPGRAGRPAFLDELKRLGVNATFVDTIGSTLTGARHELICGKTSKTVSKDPEELVVAILDLDPTIHKLP